MQVCEDNHEEIVHDQRHCPLCELLKELNEANDALQEKNDRVSTLEAQLDEARST